MYKSLVETLTLDKIRLNFKTKRGKFIDSTKISVGDCFYPTNEDMGDYFPDYGLVGDYKVGNHFKEVTFIPDPNGNYILYVTGMPLFRPYLSKKFRLGETEFKSYWQDSKIGYLAQVIQITNLNKLSTSMKTKDYVKKYKLDSKESNKFLRDEFLEDLREEFLEKIQIEQKQRKKYMLPFTIEDFNRVVKNMEQKFISISNKKLGDPLTDGLFKAFFAKCIVPIRAQYFSEYEVRPRRVSEING